MPFIGLIDTKGQEIKGNGYHRLDMSEITFRLTPPRNSNIHFVFVNASSVRWPMAKNQWPDVSGCCVFAEIDDEKPIIVSQFPGQPRRLKAGELLAMSPGQLTIDHTVTPNERRNYKPQRCPKCGAELGDA